MKKKHMELKTTMDQLVQTISKMTDAQRTAFLLLEILRVQGDVCLNRAKLEQLMIKNGLRPDDYAYEHIFIAMKNRADAILKRKSALADEDFDNM